MQVSFKAEKRLERGNYGSWRQEGIAWARPLVVYNWDNVLIQHPAIIISTDLYFIDLYFNMVRINIDILFKHELIWRWLLIWDRWCGCMILSVKMRQNCQLILMSHRCAISAWVGIGNCVSMLREPMVLIITVTERDFKVILPYGRKTIEF